MSKRIWRGRTWKRVPGMRKLYEVWRTEEKKDETCTVVEDDACFPVKEARALCDATHAYLTGIYAERIYLHQSMWNAHQKYLSAVERMKKKTGWK